MHRGPRDLPAAPAATDPSTDALADAAVATAAGWLGASDDLSRAERRSGRQLGRLVASEDGLELALGFVDRVTRAEVDRVAAGALRRVVTRGGGIATAVAAAGFLAPLDRALLGLGALVAPTVPGVAVPLARRRLRDLVGHLVLDASPARLGPRLDAARAAVGGDLNVNLLGEAVLGHREARARRDATIRLIGRHDVDYVSVKLSSIAAQLLVWDLDATVARVADELRPLYRAALAADPPVFVNLDVEEYRDLDLTLGVFSTVVMEDEFLELPAGVVLQAYLPDAHAALERLLDLAAARRARGGADLRIRLVKGANLSMERTEAALRGWTPAPYATKAETDASFRRLVDAALRPDRLVGVRLGLASHNLLDVAWARHLATARGVADRLDIEMLQGMAPGPARAVRDATGGLRLYTPVVDPADFDVAISYLVRRLEEVAAPENFLRTVLDPGAADGGRAALAAEAERFRSALLGRHTVATSPRRDQDRRLGREDPDVVRAATHPEFGNEPDTDPALPANRVWAARVAADARGGVAPRTPLVTDVAAVDAVVATARAAGERWRDRPGAVRRELLRRVAVEFAARRGAFVTAMMAEGGKTIGEADPEVSELIDFARYYADRADELEQVPGAAFDPHRVVLVVPPWNFPVAIPGGGALAALAAGAAAILKPAPEVPRCAELVVEAAQAAGVDPDLLQVLRVPDDATGQHLVTHPAVDAVVLTGSFETARLFRGWRGDLELLAETSGKNALIITPSADLDLAVADLVRSAFGHAGQKCSAASLAILVGEVATSRRFLDQLVDATTSLAAGAAHDLSTQLARLIGLPRGPLARHLEALDPGEAWLVAPRRLTDVPGVLPEEQLWTPGIKTGVRPGSHFHTHECFGPVLGLMQARDLDEAIAWQNSTGYGLTGGIHSLDDDEVAHWLDRVEVGNAYVNRPITGAIVRRQPFGGWKRSAVGPGAKAGGPAYVAQFGRWSDAPEVAALDDVAWLGWARADDERAWVSEFAVEQDPTGLAVERNALRHRPHRGVLVRVGPTASARDVARVLTAAARTGTPALVSVEPTVASAAATVVVAARAVGLPEPTVTVETEDGLIARIATADPTLDQVVVRAVGPVTPGLRAACEEAGLRCVVAPVVASGSIELGRLLREQAVSHTLHRYGRVVPGSHGGTGT
jgi:RHH-type proline utilization regulon transcriptional repressor/proline dehydrogenase/delta 1-pyrroline-5-carboxylate dehydrogenase